MAVTVSGTSITFNDATVQSTAATAPTTAQVLNATAGASAGAVGAYATRVLTGGTWSIGSTVSGNLVNSSLSGTWRAMQAGSFIMNTPTCPPYSIYTGTYLRIA